MMSSERTVRRRVYEQKMLFRREIEERLSKSSNICQNVPVNDIDVMKETESKSQDGEVCSVEPILNFKCVINTLNPERKSAFNQLMGNQFKRRADKLVDDQEVVNKQILDINLAKNPETVIDLNVINLDVRNKNGSDKKFSLRDYLQNYDEEELAEEENDFEEDLNFLLRDDDEKGQLVDEIRELCLKHIHIITHDFTKELISTLRKRTGAPFPKSTQTFLKTPRTIHTCKMGSGEYCHYGLESALRSFLDAYIRKGIKVDSIKLLVSIDGAPLAVSSEKGLWIMACSENILKMVEVVGIYHGEDKPSEVNEFLKQFKEEITFFITNGLSHNNNHYSVTLEQLVCDAPAKSYVLCVKYHSGYYSCTKCTIKGEYDDGVHFPGRIGSLRTDEKVKNREYNDPLGDDYQKNGESILKDIPNFGLVTNVVLDYMHLICLGVMLKLIEIWIKSILCEADIVKISEKLNNLKDCVPSDFSRNPRQFRKIRRLWKATELRQFLLYTGPIVLLDILPRELYVHFLYLHIAISILTNPVLCKNNDYLCYAEELLKHFVNDFEIYYGRKNVTFNVHNLLHIVADVRHFGPVDDFSAFRFENFIGKIKRLVRKGNQPLVQIGKRIGEMKACEINSDKDNTFDIEMFRPMEEIKVFKKESIVINCCNKSNNCILLRNGDYIRCHYFVKDEENCVHVIGNVFKEVDNFYRDHFKDLSDKLHVKIVRETKAMKLTAYAIDSIIAKVCMFPVVAENCFVAIPLIHTYIK